jgi:ectoine hydroxylase-related dioxygenase (phytanoyl-CoA dioxygenase family)
MEAAHEILTDELKEKFRPEPIELKKGECSFHHARMMHGSYANTTDRERRATVINVFRDGVMSNSDEPLLEGTRVIPKGEKMGGRFFPLLFDPSRIAL